jgi:hypothetical protein
LSAWGTEPSPSVWSCRNLAKACSTSAHRVLNRAKLSRSFALGDRGVAVHGRLAGFDPGVNLRSKEFPEAPQFVCGQLFAVDPFVNRFWIDAEMRRNFFDRQPTFLHKHSCPNSAPLALGCGSSKLSDPSVGDLSGKTRTNPIEGDWSGVERLRQNPTCERSRVWTTASGPCSISRNGKRKHVALTSIGESAILLDHDEGRICHLRLPVHCF